MPTTTYNGFTFGIRTKEAILAAEHRHGASCHIAQGSYNSGGVSASAGTHDRDGAVDISDAGDDQIRDWRAIGWAIWRRPTIPGLWNLHNHGILIGTVDLAWLARTQVTAYYAGRDGLAGNGPDNTPWLRPNPIPVFKSGGGTKPAPSPHLWPMWSDYPGMEKTGWGEGRHSIWNLRMQAALGVRGYVGAFPTGVDQTWTTAAQGALERWQKNHADSGSGFDEKAWDLLGRLPAFDHDTFNPHNFEVGKTSWEAAVFQMLLVLQGHASELGYDTHRTWTAKTVSATKKFQSALDLKVDGIVGPITWGKAWENHK